MHLIHNPNGTYTTVFAGREVYTGVKAVAERLGRELEWGERCPQCLKRTPFTTEMHECPGSPPDGRRLNQPTNGRDKVVA
jgi:hypothetical protein